MKCDHCYQPIADDAPVHRFYGLWGSSGAGVRGWVRGSCAEGAIYRKPLL